MTVNVIRCRVEGVKAVNPSGQGELRIIRFEDELVLARSSQTMDDEDPYQILPLVAQSGLLADESSNPLTNRMLATSQPFQRRYYPSATCTVLP